MVVGFFTGLVYLIALFYSVHDIDAVFKTTFTNPLAEVYRQATGSTGGSLGLLIVIFIPTVCTCIGIYITSGRMLWTLARGGFLRYRLSSWYDMLTSYQTGQLPLVTPWAESRRASGTPLQQQLSAGVSAPSWV